MSAPHAPGQGGAGPPGPARVAPGRLLATLGGAGAAAGALIVFVFTVTAPAIEAHRARRLDEAVTEVLKGPARYDTLYVVDGALRAEPPAGAAPAGSERVFRGHTADGTRIGYAIASQAPGFADVIRVIFGYDPASGQVLGMKVLESKETPGLGDKIEKDTAFTGQFDGAASPLIGVKPGAGKGAPGEVDMITGATISARTVIRIINDALDRLGPALAADSGSAP